MNKDQRLQRIGLRLTPTQAFINYVQHQLRHRSLADHAAILCQGWGTEPTFADLCDQIADSVEHAFYEKQDLDENSCKAAVVSAKKELLFLLYLHQHLAERTQRDQERLCFLSELLEDKILLAIAILRSKDTCVRNARINALKETVTALASIFYRYRTIVRNLEVRYFDGKNVLFHDSQELLTEIGDQLEGLSAVCATVSRDIPELTNLSNLSGIRTNAELQAETHCLDLTDAARIDALSYLGDRSAAMNVARQAAERATRRQKSIST